MMALSILAMFLFGFASLALAMNKHHRSVFGRAPERTRQRLLRWAGWGLLGAALIAAISEWGVSIGIVFWFGVATMAAPAVALLLAYQSQE